MINTKEKIGDRMSNKNVDKKEVVVRKLSESSLNLLGERYFLKGETTWEQLAERVGGIYKPATNLIKEMKFIPSTPTLMNGNTNGQRKGGLSSCFIMGLEDSIEGIFESMKEAAIVTKNAGGIGYDFSVLRSSNEEIKTLDGRKSSGPLPFMDMYNSMLDGIRQGGARKGAGGAWLDINHPSILEFIEAKHDYKTQRLNRFNLSVRVPNWFYEKLETSPNEIMQVKNVTDTTSYDLRDATGTPVTIKQLWSTIIKYAHTSAEPGILNADIAKTQCSVTNLDDRVSTNPCTEFVNIRYASCNLGSLNLSLYVDGNGNFDMESLSRDIDIVTRYLNSVIDVNEYPVENIRRVTKAIRPIGLGVMGVAHMFMKMKIPFNSEKAYAFSRKLMTYITLKSMKTSCEIAKVDGHYTAFDFDTFYNANKRFWSSDALTDNHIFEISVPSLIEDIRKYGTRNSCFTSIAPTGSISFISNTTGGIEPVYALTFARNIEKDKDAKNNITYETVYVSDSIFDMWLDEHKSSNKADILKYVASNNGSCKQCPLMSIEEQNLFLTANDLTPKEHLDSMEPWAVSTSLSISKTVNLPKTATEADISTTYIEAYKKGIIGVSVYRDGARGEGVLVHTENVGTLEVIKKHDAPKRPKKLNAEMHQFVINKQSHYVAVGLMGKDPYEVFASINHDESGNLIIPKTVTQGKIIKNGRGDYDFKDINTGIIYHLTDSHSSPEGAALTRSISTSLRHGVDISIIVQQLEKTKGALNSFSKAITRTLKHYIIDGTQVHGEKCTSCGSDLIRVEGCIKCKNPDCSYSKCG